MRRTDPNNPEAVVQFSREEPEPGTPAWVRMRQEQTFKPAGTAETRTRQFQPHRQDGKRSGVTRQKQPGVFWATLALFTIIGQSIIGPRPVFAGIEVGPAIGAALWAGFMFVSCGILLSWASQSLRWLKDK